MVIPAIRFVMAFPRRISAFTSRRISRGENGNSTGSGRDYPLGQPPLAYHEVTRSFQPAGQQKGAYCPSPSSISEVIASPLLDIELPATMIRGGTVRLHASSEPKGQRRARVTSARSM